MRTLKSFVVARWGVQGVKKFSMRELNAATPRMNVLVTHSLL